MTPSAPPVFLLLLCASVLPAATAMATSGAEAYPTHPVRFIVPNPPGGASDTLARVLGQKLSEAWGQQVVVDNRPGGNFNIAAELAAHAPPDGYTLLQTVIAHTVNPHLYAKMSFDILRDFDPVIFMATIPNILVVHPALPVKTTRELIDYAKPRPGSLTYASTGSGGPQHLGMELFKTMAGVDFLHVPYKGATPAFADLVGGQVKLMFTNMLSGLPLIRAGRVRALAISSAQRSPVVPDLPTVAETLPGFESGSWFGISVPAKTPRAIIDKLNADSNRFLKDPAVRERAGDGAEFKGGTPEAYGAFMRSEMVKWGKVVKFAQMRLE